MHALLLIQLLLKLLDQLVLLGELLTDVSCFIITFTEFHVHTPEDLSRP